MSKKPFLTRQMVLSIPCTSSISDTSYAVNKDGKKTNILVGYLYFVTINQEKWFFGEKIT